MRAFFSHLLNLNFLVRGFEQPMEIEQEVVFTFNKRAREVASVKDSLCHERVSGYVKTTAAASELVTFI